MFLFLFLYTVYGHVKQKLQIKSMKLYTIWQSSAYRALTQKQKYTDKQHCASKVCLEYRKPATTW